MAGELTLYLRAPDLTREGQIDDYTDLEAVPRRNDVGSWTLRLDWRTRHAAALRRPGYGIELVRDGATIFSGPAIETERVCDEGQNVLTVTGRDDNLWLARRRAHPQPGTAAPPYATAEHDVRNGQASSVLRGYVNANLGPGALSVRRLPGLALEAVDPLVGASVFGRARWQPLLALLQELAAAGGVEFRVRKAGTGLLFAVWAPQDKSATIRFSEGLGTLAGFRHGRKAPEHNYAFVGGTGEGTARTIREGQDPASIAAWGRAETFRDRRDTGVAAELDQDSAEALEEGAEQVGIAITPIDTDRQQYLTHYDLGDRVTYVADGEVGRDVIRELRIKLTPDEQRILPTIGSTTAVRRPGTRLLQQFRKTATRITNLERR